MSLILDIVTPDQKVFGDSVDHVVLPTVGGGEIDVLPGHIPLMAMIEPGELRYFKSGAEDSVAVDRGFIEIVGDHVRVLTEAAIEIEAIDPAEIAAAQERAETALAEAKERGDDPDILEQLETKARFTVLQKLITDRKR